jgi:cholesterol oxidase
MERTYDAVVVGSGFGGGVSACRLAEAGRRVCVLERGRRFGHSDFPERLDDAPRLLWHARLNPYGLYDVRLFNGGSVLAAAGVGGGSLLYANVQLPAEPDVFGSPWPRAIDRDALDPFYARVDEALEPRTAPADLPKVRAFAGMARLGGLEAERTPLAVHFGEPRLNPFGGVPQRGCTNLGQCVTGCPRHAKNTIDLTYLARAEKHGAELYPLHEVVGIAPPGAGERDWHVACRDLQYGGTRQIAATVVVLAAGALGSTRLLLICVGPPRQGAKFVVIVGPSGMEARAVGWGRGHGARGRPGLSRSAIRRCSRSVT